VITYTKTCLGVKITFSCVLYFNNVCVLCAFVGNICCMCKMHGTQNINIIKVCSYQKFVCNEHIYIGHQIPLRAHKGQKLFLTFS
jgi:hypothetical protein